LKEKKEKKEIKVVLENLFITPFISREDPNWGPPKQFLEKTMKVGYAKAVNIIEKFMKNSGIRAICSNYCMGRCCGTCYTSERACHKNEGRRLACSFYICYSLKELVFTDYEKTVFDSVDRLVGGEIRVAISSSGKPYPNIYFDINDQSARNKFSIDINILNKLDKIDRDNVRAKTFALCRLHQDFCLRAKKSGK